MNNGESNRKSVRKLHAGHFVFMRALLDGRGVQDVWNRYLRLEGEYTHHRQVGATVAWIRSEFAAAAIELGRHDMARWLVQDAPSQHSPSLRQPELEHYVLDGAMEDLDEAGQVQSRSTPDGTATIKRSGRVQWQLHSLRWLQARVAQAPRITDSLDTWFKPALARRLRVAGIPTLLTLTARINGIGTLWWLDVPGMSEKKAGHIVAWLRTHEGSLRLGDGNHINPRRTVLVAARQTRAALL